MINEVKCLHTGASSTGIPTDTYLVHSCALICLLVARCTYNGVLVLDEVVQCTNPSPSLPPPSLPSPSPFSCLSLPLFSPVSKVCNRVLALDEVVQFTEQDEWAYHEMVAHVPLFSHPNPRSVSGVCAITLELLLLFYCTVASFLCFFFSPSLLLLPLSPVSFLILLTVCLLSFSLTSFSIRFPYSPHRNFCLSPSLPPYLLPPSSSLLPISQGAGGRRGRWRCAERGCETQDSRGNTHLWDWWG